MVSNGCGRGDFGGEVQSGENESIAIRHEDRFSDAELFEMFGIELDDARLSPKTVQPGQRKKVRATATRNGELNDRIDVPLWSVIRRSTPYRNGIGRKEARAQHFAEVCSAIADEVVVDASEVPDAETENCFDRLPNGHLRDSHHEDIRRFPPGSPERIEALRRFYSHGICGDDDSEVASGQEHGGQKLLFTRPLELTPFEHSCE